MGPPFAGLGNPAIRRRGRLAALYGLGSRLTARLRTWPPTVRPIWASSPAAWMAVVTSSVPVGGAEARARAARRPRSARAPSTPRAPARPRAPGAAGAAGRGAAAQARRAGLGLAAVRGFAAAFGFGFAAAGGLRLRGGASASRARRRRASRASRAGCRARRLRPCPPSPCALFGLAVFSLIGSQSTFRVVLIAGETERICETSRAAGRRGHRAAPRPWTRDERPPRLTTQFRACRCWNGPSAPT